MLDVTAVTDAWWCVLAAGGTWWAASRGAAPRVSASVGTWWLVWVAAGVQAASWWPVSLAVETGWLAWSDGVCNFAMAESKESFTHEKSRTSSVSPSPAVCVSAEGCELVPRERRGASLVCDVAGRPPNLGPVLTRVDGAGRECMLSLVLGVESVRGLLLDCRRGGDGETQLCFVWMLGDGASRECMLLDCRDGGNGES